MWGLCMGRECCYIMSPELKVIYNIDGGAVLSRRKKRHRTHISPSHIVMTAILPRGIIFHSANVGLQAGSIQTKPSENKLDSSRGKKEYGNKLGTDALFEHIDEETKNKCNFLNNFYTEWKY